MKQRMRYWLSILLVCAMVLSLLPVSALADGPDSSTSTQETSTTTSTESAGDLVPAADPETEPSSGPANGPEPAPETVTTPIYVSETGNDITGTGKESAPYATLAKAVKAVDDGKIESAVIYVMSDLIMTESAQYWSGDITITSDPKSLKDAEKSTFTISRAETGFKATGDRQRGGYNGPMLEVGNDADLTLENIVLDDGGYAAYSENSATVSGKTPYFVQVESGGNGYTTIDGQQVSNHQIVQDAIITSFSEYTTITLGEGAVLQNYGGMSAVRASNATLIMEAGSKICDTNGMTRIKGAEGSLGPKGAVWVQNGEFIMNEGAEISGIDGRAVYAEAGQVEIGGTISNLTYNANFQNAFQGLAVHLRAGANGEVSGEVYNLTYPDNANVSSALHVVNQGVLTVSGSLHDISLQSIVGGNSAQCFGCVINGEEVGTKVEISGEIYNITAASQKHHYVLSLSGAAEGTLLSAGEIRDITGNVVYLCDTSGQPGEGDSIPGKFTMQSSSEISQIQGKVIYAEVWRDSETMPSPSNPIEPKNRDHVTVIIDGKIHNIECKDHLIHFNADVNAFGEFAKTPGEFGDITIGENAEIYDNEVSAVFGGQGGTFYVDGKIYENAGNIYTGYSNCGGALIYLQDQAEIYNNNVKTGTVFSLGNARLIMDEGSSIHDNYGSGTASVIHVGSSGQFILNGGKIYNNTTTAEYGGLISYFPNTSYSNIYDSRVWFERGEIYDNTSAGGYDFIIAGSGAPSFIAEDSERTLHIPDNIITEDIDIYYQQITHQDSSTKETVVDYYGKSMTVEPGTKLGLVSTKDITENETVTSSSLTALKQYATSFGLAAPFTTFWAYSEVGTPVSIKMDPAQEGQTTTPTFDPTKPVYVLINKTNSEGYPATDTDVIIQAATVDTDGTIHFDVKAGGNGAAIALAQPDIISGALTLSTTVTEIKEGLSSYTIPYQVTFDLGKAGISVDAIRSATVTFYSTNGDWNRHTMELTKDSLSGTWSAVLSAQDFQAGQTITTSAKIEIKTDTGNKTFYSNAVGTKMTAVVTPDPEPDPGTGTDTRDDYTLHYVTNGGKHLSSETKSSSWTKDYEDLPTPIRDGYTFEGWYWDLRLTEPVTGDVKVNKTTVTLYAKWSSGNYAPDDTGVSKWLETDKHNAFLSGYPDGSFLADKNMTRAEVAQMFYSLLLDKDVKITKSFSDVPTDAWYAKAVNTLSSLGMLGGYPDGTFRPDAPITRAEFAAIALAFAYDPASAICSYTDVNTSAWYYTYVAQATTYGWISGYPDGSFRPNNSITRAEVAVIVNNMLGRNADESYIDRNADELVSFVDLSKNHWAYYTIIEATNSHDYTSASSGETWTCVK